MKTLTQAIQEALLTTKSQEAIAEALLTTKLNDAIAFPEGAEVIMISPNDMEGSLAFMSIEDIKKDGGLDKVLELKSWESTVIDEDIYVMLADPSTID